MFMVKTSWFFFVFDNGKSMQINIQVRLLIMRMAEAPAASATFALVVKLQFPRCTRIISPVSYRQQHLRLISHLSINCLQKDMK